MTELDRSLWALTRPGEAAAYFAPVIEVSPHVGEPAGFDLVRAWWLAELSRLVYVAESGDPAGGSGARGRRFWLARVGMREQGIIDDQHGHLAAMIVESTGERAPAGRYLIFRGTDSIDDWAANLLALQRPFDGIGHAHAGFIRLLEGLWSDLAAAIANPGPPVVIAGHSLGGALAVLAALRAHGQSLRMGGCYTFGAPMVGNRPLAAYAEQLPIFRVANHLDIVTMLPVDGPLGAWSHAGSSWYFDGAGGLHGHPVDACVRRDRLAATWLSAPQAIQNLLAGASRFGRGELPDYLSDHAPVNYVARLEQAIATQDGTVATSRALNAAT